MRESSYNHRRAEIQAAYLLPHVHPHHHVLDVGAGSGSITRDFASLCSSGRVVGIDYSVDMVKHARKTYLDDAVETPPKNLSFEVCNAEDLSIFPDASFDIVHAHTCLTHVHDRVGALREFLRVCKPGGVVAVRDPLDIERQVVWRPDLPAMRLHGRIAATLLRAKGGDPEAGSHLVEWAREAGYEKNGGKITVGLGEERQTKMLNIIGAGIGKEEAIQLGIINEKQLDEFNEAYDIWYGTEDHICIGKVAEMLCFKGLGDQ
ncbi:Putative methyltransferase type 11, S-adenosyl-L-methionine-dependent methyltransferase superfamily [Colletotrichum destructivum]|uniref:Methyltransferase type 11, S-adenosyl-L-methionine-dependent methyltransferase superfamily n=1 Tax=Colletotrichum destructivum TaxID=34406 RepID=A0AAX4J3C8_9PEZI|nr:Putative methyltransferase type 11, S-adenosyl-L-methionine-dependent methyltransferase superfamily [Colletotrichum destructivum]